MNIPAVENLEITLLLEAIFHRFGEDFRAHQKTAIRGRLRAFMHIHGIETVSRLQDLLLHNPAYLEPLMNVLNARSTGLFDHPDSIFSLRKVIVPWLRSYPAPKIWLAECVSAEDVYALAIILIEENLYEKTQIFATGANASLLMEARSGRFSVAHLQRYQKNYHLAGGKQSLENYYEQCNGTVRFKSELAQNITWAHYNLGTNASFNEFEFILCNGGLSDYTSRLRRRALQLFYESLPTFGILNISGAEHTELAPFISRYKILSQSYGLYQRIT